MFVCKEFGLFSLIFYILCYLVTDGTGKSCQGIRLLIIYSISATQSFISLSSKGTGTLRYVSTMVDKAHVLVLKF